MAAAVRVYLVRAFGQGAEGGNPAGVVIDAEGLPAAQMQAVAARVGYSETAFVLRSSKADFKVHFFTPNKQIANCGHATVATFSLLRQRGIIRKELVSVETLNGVGAVRFERDLVLMEQKPLEDLPLEAKDAEELLAAIGLPATRALEGFAPRVASTGAPFFLIGVASEKDLADLRPDLPKLEELSARRQAIGAYVFARPRGGDFAATARMFAPYYGIAEESATGMAAGPLAWMLAARLGLSRDSFLIEQGRFMRPPSPSTIEARVSKKGGQVVSIVIGGRGFIAAETDVPLAG